MKKQIVLFALLLSVLALAGCGEQVSTASFHGEHEYFAVSGGSIALDGQEVTFDGGSLEITQPDAFGAVTSYTATFYLLTDDGENAFLSSSRSDKTGAATPIGRSLGKVSGEGIFGSDVRNVEDLAEKLWFELKTTEQDGAESVYRIRLTVTE